MALLAREDVVDPATLVPMLEQSRKAETSQGQSGSLEGAVRQWLQEQRPSPGSVYETAQAAFERPLFEAILAETGGNQLRAAQILGINRNTLRKRLSDLEIDPDRAARQL